MKKYELTEETIMINGSIKLYRIRALKNFSNVKAGALGGYVESENNLSQEGNCWIYDSAQVYGSARVYGSALVSNSARVFDTALVSDYARVYDSAQVFGNARVYGFAGVFEMAGPALFRRVQ